MNSIRKQAVVFLLLLNALPFLMSFLFSVYQLWIRHEMLEKLEWQKLHTVVIRQQDLHWEEEGRELLIEGRMFDVKRMQPDGEQVILMGLYDEEETRLLQEIEGWHKDSEDEQLLLGLGQLFHNWQAEKQMDILTLHTLIIPIHYTVFEESLPPLPEKDGLIHPPDFMEC